MAWYVCSTLRLTGSPEAAKCLVRFTTPCSVIMLIVKYLHYSVMRHNVHLHPHHYSTAQYSTVHYSTVQYSTVQYSTVQYSTVQYSTVQYSTVKYNTVQYRTVQYSTVRYRVKETNKSSSGNAHKFSHVSATLPMCFPIVESQPTEAIKEHLK